MTSEHPSFPRRIAVIGTSGSGKTTFARRVAAAIDAPHLELDGFFHQPNWVPAEREVFRARVSDAIAAPAWVTDGNYTGFLRDIVWPAVDTIIWLDYPFRIVIWRLFGRTMGRAFKREELWNGNRESLREHFFTKQSLFLWAKNTHWKHRREWLSHLESPAMAHVRVIRLRQKISRRSQACLRNAVGAQPAAPAVRRHTFRSRLACDAACRRPHRAAPTQANISRDSVAPTPSA